MQDILEFKELLLEDKMDDKAATVSFDAISSTTDDSSSLQRQTGVKRIFRDYQIFFFALAYMSSWEAVLGSLTAILYNGGPQCFIWGTVIAIAGALAQSASLAEMSSMLPIAGAQYHWTAHLARSHARFVTWIQGWSTLFGWITLVTGQFCTVRIG